MRHQMKYMLLFSKYIVCHILNKFLLSFQEASSCNNAWNTFPSKSNEEKYTLGQEYVTVSRMKSVNKTMTLLNRSAFALKERNVYLIWGGFYKLLSAAVVSGTMFVSKT